MDPLCNRSSCLLAVLRGARNGFYYGARVRAPHALVMTFLFRQGSFKDKISDVVHMTLEHARNLATYVACFKAILCVLRQLTRSNDRWVHFVSGVVGGVIVFGKDTPVNSQVNMYVLSRIVVGMGKWLAKKGYVPAPLWSYQLFAGMVWGMVMLLFEFEGVLLPKSLVASMEFLYHDSDRWPSSVRDWFLQW